MRHSDFLTHDYSAMIKSVFGKHIHAAYSAKLQDVAAMTLDTYDLWQKMTAVYVCVCVCESVCVCVHVRVLDRLSSLCACCGSEVVNL